MTQRISFSGNLIVAATLVCASAFAGDATTSSYRIMTDDEVAAHRQTMQMLSGQARDDYRNAQYAHLRQRALDNGYRMPASPPWQSAGAATADSAAGGASMADIAARHEALREKLQARRNEAPALSDAKTADGVTPPRGPAVSVPAQATASAPQTPPPSEALVPAPAITAPASPPPVSPAAASPEPAQSVEPVAQSDVQDTQPAHAKTQDAAAAAAPQVVAPADTTGSEMSAAAESGGHAGSQTISAYREAMRSRFDEYMRERQAQHEETIRQQREQREAAIEQSRAQISRNRPPQPYPYPTAPGYGPRYPAAFPGYRTPYWQQ
ncbi:MAG: hypothetical protein H6959_06110 [Chromatiaceae bacterium]|nr:hypothetical protein [Chromatiaceae bacterium]MCP5422472.1 hypothetical protein [Chromatiaceae bacterium]